MREGYSLQLLCSSSEAIVSYTIANFADIAGLILTCNDTVVVSLMCVIGATFYKHVQGSVEKDHV